MREPMERAGGGDRPPEAGDRDRGSESHLDALDVDAATRSELALAATAGWMDPGEFYLREVEEEPSDGAEKSALRPLHGYELEHSGRELLARCGPDEWRRATGPEREAMAKDAHDFLRQEYGLQPLGLRLESAWGPDPLGEFDPSSGRVSVNAALLFQVSPAHLVETLAHENRHAVQASLITELEQAHLIGLARPRRSDVDWDEVRLWHDAANHYTSTNWIGYFYGPLEVDAREAATQVIRGYTVEYMERRLAADEDQEVRH